MAVCTVCNQEMHEADGCIRRPSEDGLTGNFEAVKFGNETDPDWREYTLESREMRRL